MKKGRLKKKMENSCNARIAKIFSQTVLLKERVMNVITLKPEEMSALIVEFW